MPRWYEPLLTFLAQQQPETASVTLTFADLEVLVGRPLPARAVSRSYWRHRKPGGMGHRLAALGWRVGPFGRGQTSAITFVRLQPDANG